MQTETSRRRKHQTSEESYAGPARPYLPPTPPRTPSLSPKPEWKRARRTKGSSEDSISGISVEEFRVGGPILCGLPVYTGSLSRSSRLSIAWRTWLEKEITTTLRQCNIDWQAAEAVTRYTATTNETPVETVVISAIKHADSASWLKACKTILRLYASSGLKDINIEIADGRAFLPVNSFGVERTMAISRIWSSLETRIITILNRQDWLALELLHRGVNQKAQDNPVTVVITIHEASEMNWTKIREDIISLLESNRYYEVAVEIIRGKISCTEGPGKRLDMSAYQTKTEMGRSIGPGKLADGSGTFCGYVRLLSPKNGLWRTFGMTCHHVALPKALSHPLMLKWEQFGMRTQDGQATKFEITMPSRSDHLYTINGFRETIANLKTKDHEKTREMLATNQEVPKQWRGNFITVEKVINSYQGYIHQAEAFFGEGKAHLGTVFATSSFRQTLPLPGRPLEETMCLDWALIDVSDIRRSYNFYPDMQSAQVTDNNYPFVPLSQCMVTTALPEIGEPVFMRGRTSGAIVGIYNGIDHTILQFWRKDERGIMIQIRSRAHTVRRMFSFGDTTGCFGQAGDSGSAVLDKEGSFLGLYFGGNTSTGVGLFILWRELFADIQNITKATAVELLPGPP